MRHAGGRARGPRLLAGSVLAGLAIAACTGPAGGPQAGIPRSGGKATVASWQEPDTLLAAGITGSNGHAFAVASPVMEGLLRVRPAAEVPRNPGLTDYYQPQLATGIPTLENGGVKVVGNKMEVTWKLRKGVRWHDGTAFSAKDVKATYEFWWLRYQDKNPTPVLSTSGWDQVEGVETPDETTAVVRYKSVFGPYLMLGTGPYGILPEHLLQQTWAKSGDLTREKLEIAIPGGFSGKASWDKWLVGTGPFLFKEWMAGDHITLARNPNWWGPHRAYLDQLVIRFETDALSQLEKLRTGAIDLGLDFGAGLLGPLGHLISVQTDVLTGIGVEKIDLNLHNKFLADVAVRRAILMAIDRQEIVDTLAASSTTVPPDSWLCSGTREWCADPSGRHTRVDLKAARDLLDGAGYRFDADRCGRGFRSSPGGDCLQLSLVAPVGNPLSDQEAVAIANQLKQLGIRVTRSPASPKAGKLLAPYAQGGILATHAFEMAVYTRPAWAPGEPEALARVYVSSQIPSADNRGMGENDTSLNDPRVDAAFGAGRGTVVQADRKPAYILAQRAIADLLPEIPLYHQLTVIAHSKKLAGYKGNAAFWLANAEEWYLVP